MNDFGGWGRRRRNERAREEGEARSESWVACEKEEERREREEMVSSNFERRRRRRKRERNVPAKGSSCIYEHIETDRTIRVSPSSSAQIGKLAERERERN